MLKHWSNLLNTDCLVVQIGKHAVYPIYRVGSTSLELAADKVYTNDEIRECEQIEVLIRDPGARFVSGINEYSRLNYLDVSDTLSLVEQGTLIDRHFAPQYIWLLHLSKYFKGKVKLHPFEYIKKITNLHYRKDASTKTPVKLLKSFIDVDNDLLKLVGQTFELKDLIERHRNALS